eukprot:tig00021616_g22918.t1
MAFAGSFIPARSVRAFASSVRRLQAVVRPQTRVTSASMNESEGPIVETTAREVKDEAGASAGSSSSGAGASFKGSEPRRFYVAPEQAGNVFGASLASLMRLGVGAFVEGYSLERIESASAPRPSGYSLEVGGQRLVESNKLGKRPEKPLELYEFEACPFCRKVREAVSILDIDVIVYPCPKDGTKWRPEAIEKGGKKQFPYLVDPNTGVAMYESDEIIRYLFSEYGSGEVPLPLRLGALTTLTAGLATGVRPGRGRARRAGASIPEKPLEFWAYEPSPFCRVVREVLCELETPYLLRTCARGSPKRSELLERTGRFQVPYLEDPNTGVKLFESADIIRYLESTYGGAGPSSEA